MASPLVEARHGANLFALVSQGVPFTATAGAVLNIRLSDVAGVTTWELDCIGTDETSTPLVVTRDAAPALSASATIPAALGKAFIFRSRINGGRTQGVADPNLTYTFKVDLPTGAGRSVGAVNEKFESDAQYGYVGIVNKMVRASSTLPAGSGLAAVNGGAGATVPYGTAYQFARMNAAGTAVTFQDLIPATGSGLSFTGGLLGVLLANTSLGINASLGLFVRLGGNGGASGLSYDANGLFVGLDAATTGFSGLVLSANGLKANGNILVARYDAFGTATPGAPISVTTFTPTYTSIQVQALGTLAVGMVVEATGMFNRLAGVVGLYVLEISTSATPGTGVVYSTKAWKSGAAEGADPTAIGNYVVASAVAHWVHLRAAKVVTGDAAHSITDSQMSAKVFR